MTTATTASPKKVFTGVVRASYVNVFNTKFNDLSGKDEYSLMILIPKKDKETVSKIKKAIDFAREGKWKDKTPKGFSTTFKDGDDEEIIPESVEVGDAPYAGHYFMNLKTSTKPGVVDRNLDKIIDESTFRSGDYCRVSIVAFAYDQKGNRGISFALHNIQVLKKGEPLGGQSRAEDDFDVVDEDDDEMDFLD